MLSVQFRNEEEMKNQDFDLNALYLGKKSTERMENMQKKMDEMTEENAKAIQRIKQIKDDLLDHTSQRVDGEGGPTTVSGREARPLSSPENLGKSPAEKKGPLEEEAIVTNLPFSLPVPPEPHGGPGVSPMALVLNGFTGQSSASD